MRSIRKDSRRGVVRCSKLNVRMKKRMCIMKRQNSKRERGRSGVRGREKRGRRRWRKRSEKKSIRKKGGSRERKKRKVREERMRKKKGE